MEHAQPDKLHDAAKAAWLRSGRDPQAFEGEWPKIQQRLLARAAEVNLARQTSSRHQEYSGP